MEEEAGKMDEIPSTGSKDSQQTENIVDLKNQDSNTSDIDIDDNLTGLTEFWELVEHNVDDDMDKVSESKFSLHYVDEPVEQEIDRGLPDSSEEQGNETYDENFEGMKSGDFDKKIESNKTEVLKTYPKRSSRNVPPTYYGWSSYNPLNWV